MPAPPPAVSHGEHATTDRARAEAVLGEMYRRGRVPALEGPKEFDLFPVGLTEGPGRALAELLRGEGAHATLETGFAFGLSALWILSATSGPHTAVDLCQTSDYLGAGVRAVREAQLGHRLTLIERDSALALPELVTRGASFDAGFIDGNHRFEGVFLDLCFALRLVRPGGLVILDDRWMPSVRAAADYAARNLGVPLVTLDDHAAERRFIALRRPASEPTLAWDGFEAFGAEGMALPGEVDAGWGADRPNRPFGSAST